MNNIWYYIQQWTKDEQYPSIGRNMDDSDDDRLTIRDDVPMIEEDNDPHNGE